MPRLFTGLEIPRAQSDRLMMLRGDIITARWIETSNYHITLRFLGDVSRHTANEFCDKIAELSLDLDPFSLTIKSVGHFGSKRAHALWAGLEKNEALVNLHKMHERAAIEVGLEHEPRKFIPHITLARLSRTRPSTIAPFLVHFADFQLEPFEVTKVNLYSAKPSTGGGPYVVEEVFPFAEEE